MKYPEKEKLIIDPELIEDGQAVVLGLSGGPDSVCLLLELLALSNVRKETGGCGNRIICAHVNHGLRGQEADGDEAFVVSLCDRLGVEACVKHIDAAAIAKEKGLTVEEAGREARYEFFEALCDQYQDSAPVIAVAHNQDDHIETVLMRIMRGTGIDGLAGIAKKRRTDEGFYIVRPLLGASRKAIEERLAEYGENARTDGSNLQTEYFRNMIRLEILPCLEEASGFNFRNSLLRLAENAAEDRDYFEAVVEEALDELSADDDSDETREQLSSIAFPADVLAGVHPAIRHRLVRAAFAELGLKADIAAIHLAAADRLLETFTGGGEASGKRVEFPSDYTFGIVKKKAVFRAPQAADPDWKPRRKR